MSLSRKGIQISDMKLNTSSKLTTLNPNAAEFVPFAHRSSSISGSTSRADVTAKFATSGSFEKVLDRSESSVSNISDDEAHQYWRSQLPDDITPDFKVMNEDDHQGIGSLSFSGLSLLDHSEASRVPATRRSSSLSNGFVYSGQHELSPRRVNGSSYAEKIRYSTSSYSEDPSFTSSLHLPAKPWDNQLLSSDQFLGNGKEGNPFDFSRNVTLNDMLGDHTLQENAGMNALDFLASQFPKFSLESIEDVYFSNVGDMRLTVENLAQLELQGDSGFTQNLNLKALSASNHSALDFQSLTRPDRLSGPPKYIGDDLLQSASPYQSSQNGNSIRLKRSSSIPFAVPINFSSAVKELASQDPCIWNGSADSTIGPSKSSHLLVDSYSSGHGRGIYGDRLHTLGSSCSDPVWLETGGTVATMRPELQEDARSYSHLHNAYIEQARQAYLHNKASAKELSVKGQLHNTRMKAAHGKAQESIYHQRKPIRPGTVRGAERMIDLHSLHASEALIVLKHELSALRSITRAVDRPLQVYIHVGTQGSRSPAKLPVAVQWYLLEEEGLDYVEPQPGLLRVVIY